MPMTHPYFAVPTPIVIGHRGCAGEAPENTLPAFERGLADGAAILESDVHVTRDGVPVLVHDPDVDRVTDGSGHVAAHTLAELQRLDAGHHFSPDGGISHPFRGRGVRIPSFEQALQAFPGARFNIELKDPAPGAAEATLDVVLRQRREDLTLLTAGDSELMLRLRTAIDARQARVAQGASTADIVELIRSAQEGRAPRSPAMAVQVPREFAGAPLVSRAFVDHAHANDIQVHVWTINTAAEMAELLDLGVDGIVTDLPARLVGVIRKRAHGGH
jgi:glycerophosphoryl diester phosphodiesterase